MKIRITLKRLDYREVLLDPIVKEFDDEHEAANWLISDSYFMEPYTLEMKWERIRDY